MGGQKGKSQEDYRMEEENARRQAEMDKQARESRRKAIGMEYNNMYNEATGGARTKAAAAITSERAEGIKKYTKMQRDYHAQERRRLFEAKKGTGQVDASDTAITADMYKESQDFLNRDQDYWDAKRAAAGDEAFTKGKKDFLAKYGTEGDYWRSIEGEDDAAARRQRGREYQGSGGTPKVNPNRSHTYPRKNLFNQRN